MYKKGSSAGWNQVWKKGWEHMFEISDNLDRVSKSWSRIFELAANSVCWIGWSNMGKSRFFRVYHVILFLPSGLSVAEPLSHSSLVSSLEGLRLQALTPQTGTPWGCRQHHSIKSKKLDIIGNFRLFDTLPFLTVLEMELLCKCLWPADFWFTNQPGLMPFSQVMKNLPWLWKTFFPGWLSDVHTSWFL